MPDTSIKLSALWVAVMLTYLLGDVLRIYNGDLKVGELSGVKAPPALWLGVAALMVVPIVMVVLSVTLDRPVARWVNIAAAVVMFGFNVIGLPTYPSVYDRFLIAVGLLFNVVAVAYAWRWE